jgi:hypothetical protein
MIVWQCLPVKNKSLYFAVLFLHFWYNGCRSFDIIKSFSAGCDDASKEDTNRGTLDVIKYFWTEYRDERKGKGNSQ